MRRLPSKPHRRLSEWFDRGYKKLEAGYRHVLAFSLNHRVIMLVAALLLFAGSLYMTKYLGKEFTPPEDQGQFIVRLEAPIDYSVDKADELFRPAEEILRGCRRSRRFFTDWESAARSTGRS